MPFETRDMSLLEAVYHWEATTPDRVYLTQPVGGGHIRRYTWRETLDQARRMAAHLQELGLPEGGQIGLLSKNCAHFFIAELAAWIAGRATVAIYPTYDARSVRYVLEHSDTRLLFVGKLDGWDDLRQGIPAGLPCIALPLAPPTDYSTWDEITEATAPLSDRPLRAADELATIVYTSGSTGKPKGVMHSVGGIDAAIRGLDAHFGELFADTTSERLLSYLPLAHVFERLYVEYVSLAGGCQVFFAESLETFMDDLRRARPTIFVSVPRLWIKFRLGVFEQIPPRRLELLLRIPLLSRPVRKKILAALGLDAVRLSSSGSAPLPPEVLTWYRRLGLELNEGYGMTEDLGYSHYGRPGEGRAGYVGNPMPGVEIRLSDEGEVLIRSPAAMIGYYKDPELTAASRTGDGFFRTGDLGERDAQGRLKITGRLKELFKTSKGKYVAPAPIENLLNNDPRVEQSCVVGAGMTRPLALVLLAEELRARRDDPATRRTASESLTSLLETVNRTVLHYERLERLVVVKDEWQIGNGFLTATMKIKRGAIEEAYAPRLDEWYGASEPVVWER